VKGSHQHSHWQTLADIPPQIRESGIRHAMSVPSNLSALDRISSGVEATMLRLFRHEQARLAVAGIRADHPEVTLVEAEHAAALIACLSPLTVRNLRAAHQRKEKG
jgi:O-acetylhomoserine/O-acetylserine sulfhydrylase-like pyridoxal-dependent enzyme